MGLALFSVIFAHKIFIDYHQNHNIKILQKYMIKRQLQDVIEKRLFMGKAIIVIGARQVGKSTLFKMVLDGHKEPTLQLNCDEPEVKEMLSQANTQELRMLIGSNRIILIDEAQRVDNIGMTLKRITDNFPDVQLLVTGSSSFELQNKLNEPLTGRKFEYHLFPFSTGELMNAQGLLYVKQNLDNRLIYGSYPDIINHNDDAKELLYNLSSSYLYKDLLNLESIRRPALLNKLLTALALQVTSEVSYNELAQTIGTDNKTVEKYIDLLEKCYIIFKLNGFNRNIRTELKRAKKFYFYDNGIRNAILQNFSPLSLRQDVGALWENFFISERIKANQYARRFVNSYFWRTNQQQEIDYIEECDGQFSIFEMKWNPKRANTQFPSSFISTYNVKEKAIVTPNNWPEWVL